MLHCESVPMTVTAPVAPVLVPICPLALESVAPASMSSVPLPPVLRPTRTALVTTPVEPAPLKVASPCALEPMVSWSAVRSAPVRTFNVPWPDRPTVTVESARKPLLSACITPVPPVAEPILVTLGTVRRESVPETVTVPLAPLSTPRSMPKTEEVTWPPSRISSVPVPLLPTWKAKVGVRFHCESAPVTVTEPVEPAWLPIEVVKVVKVPPPETVTSPLPNSPTKKRPKVLVSANVPAPLMVRSPVWPRPLPSVN